MFSKLLGLLALIIFTSCASYIGKKSYEIKKDIQYSPENKNLLADLYLSKNNAPIIVLVHGGGWSSRNKNDMNQIAKSLASNGFSVFNINYRLAPENRHPAPVEDLLAAVNYLKLNENKYQYNLSKLALWGYSSGGHTTSLFTMKYPHLIKANVSGGAPYDLTWYPYSPYIKKYLGEYRAPILNEYIDASPIFKIPSKLPPFFLYHAYQDKLVEYTQMTAFEARMVKNGHKVSTHTVDFWGHSSTFIFSSESIKRGVKFLQKELL